VGEPLQRQHVAIAEVVGTRRKNLNHAPHSVLGLHRDNQNGAQAEPAADGGVKSRISFSIIAALRFTRAKASMQDRRMRVQIPYNVTCRRASFSEANPLARTRQNDRSPGRRGRQARLLHDLLRSGVN
jgi:hypothetical protein